MSTIGSANAQTGINNASAAQLSGEAVGRTAEGAAQAEATAKLQKSQNDQEMGATMLAKAEQSRKKMFDILMGKA
jgi:hypothetical protein